MTRPDPEECVPQEQHDGAASSPADALTHTDRLDRYVDDVLVGWDVGEPHGSRASGSLDRGPFPIDALVVASAALAGLFAGARRGGRRRGASAALGALAGVVLAGALRRIWESPA